MESKNTKILELGQGRSTTLLIASGDLSVELTTSRRHIKLKKVAKLNMYSPEQGIFSVAISQKPSVSFVRSSRMSAHYSVTLRTT